VAVTVITLTITHPDSVPAVQSAAYLAALRRLKAGDYLPGSGASNLAPLADRSSYQATVR
jgi:hypothetical protein